MNDEEEEQEDDSEDVPAAAGCLEITRPAEMRPSFGLMLNHTAARVSANESATTTTKFRDIVHLQPMTLKGSTGCRPVTGNSGGRSMRRPGGRSVDRRRHRSLAISRSYTTTTTARQSHDRHPTVARRHRRDICAAAAAVS